MRQDPDLELALGAFEMRGPMRREQQVRLRGALMTFGFRDGVFVAQPMAVFRPVGLVIWGAPPRSVVEHIQIASMLEGSVTPAPIPVRWFESGDNYEQIAAKLDAGQDLPAWVQWSAVRVGQIVQVRLQTRDGKPLGPDDGIEIVMWGTAAF